MAIARPRRITYHGAPIVSAISTSITPWLARRYRTTTIKLLVKWTRMFIHSEPP